MRKMLMRAVVGLVAVLVFFGVVFAQGRTQAQQDNPNKWKYDPNLKRDPWTYYPNDVPPGFPDGDGGPAPKRSLTGTWNGPQSGPGVPSGKGAAVGVGRSLAGVPELTPLAQNIMSGRKTIGEAGPGGTNDPYGRYCDPFGYPRNMYQQNRAMQVAEMPDRIIFLLQHGYWWREVWMDGRALPTNIGVRGGVEPTLNGYSVGHWEDDNTLVIETVGVRDDTWLTGRGLPHSIHARYTERWKRIDHNTMMMEISIDDPTMYAKPFSLGQMYFRWVPNQYIDEYICMPSEVQQYLEEEADPAGSTEGLRPETLHRAPSQGEESGGQ
jgi:hypothetical protein